MAIHSETGEEKLFHCGVEGDGYGKSLISLFNEKYIGVVHTDCFKIFHFNESNEKIQEITKRNLEGRFKDFVSFGEQNNYILGCFYGKCKVAIYRVKEIKNNKLLIELRNHFDFTQLVALNSTEGAFQFNVVYTPKIGNPMMVSASGPGGPFIIFGYHKENKKMKFRKYLKSSDNNYQSVHTIGMIKNPFEDYYTTISTFETTQEFIKLVFNFKKREYIVIKDKTIDMQRIYKFHYIEEKVIVIGNTQELIEIEFEAETEEKKKEKGEGESEVR